MSMALLTSQKRWKSNILEITMILSIEDFWLKSYFFLYLSFPYFVVSIAGVENSMKMEKNKQNL